MNSINATNCESAAFFEWDKSPVQDEQENEEAASEPLTHAALS